MADVAACPAAAEEVAAAEEEDRLVVVEHAADTALEIFQVAMAVVAAVVEMEFLEGKVVSLAREAMVAELSSLPPWVM